MERTKYMRESGSATTSLDPARAVWYGNCGYWTDEWDKLAAADGIPCCPECRRPGFITTHGAWFKAAREYEAASHPRYAEFLDSTRWTCYADGPTFPETYASWAKLQAKKEGGHGA